MAFTKGKSGNPAGRPRGIIDKRHMERVCPRVPRVEGVVDSFDGTPAEFFESIYKDQTLPLNIRMAAAATLIRAGIGGASGGGVTVIIQGDDRNL